MVELELLLALALLVVLLLRMRLFLLLLLLVVSKMGDRGATKRVFGKGVLIMVNGFLIGEGGVVGGL